MAESGIPTVRMPRMGAGAQPPKPLLFLGALEESLSGHLDPPDERALETRLVTLPPPTGAERYSAPVVTC
jgi:hypothetical protein